MRVLTWTTSGRAYAIDTGRIVEVVPVVDVRRMDHVEAWLRGLMNHRGRLIPLLDTKALLSGSTVELRRSSRIIVVQLDPDDRSSMCGLLVESVRNVEEIDFSDETTHPGLANPETAYLGKIALVDDEAVQVLEPEKILKPEQREVIFGRARSVEA